MVSIIQIREEFNMQSKKWNQDAVIKLLQKRKEEETSSFTDQRFWFSAPPKKGEKRSEAVYRIRVLPNMKAGGEYCVKILRHGFQAPSGSWIIENCPKTLGNKCPIDEYAGPLFNDGDPSHKNFASKIYNKKNYIANILVIKDPRDNGVNEGKVFLWRFGQKLYNKFDTAIFPPEDSGLEKIIFFDPYNGYDLNLVVTIQKDGNVEYPNYDNSVFVRESTSIGKNDGEVDKILESCYDLEGEFLAPNQFKSYDELKVIFDNNVVNYRKAIGEQSQKKNDSNPTPTPKPEASSTKVAPEKTEADSVSDDEFLSNLEAELNK
jgi:hypothetical protein